MKSSLSQDAKTSDCNNTRDKRKNIDENNKDKIRKFWTIICVIVFIIATVMAISVVKFLNVTLEQDKVAIKDVINSEYTSYEIKNIELLYADWSSTIREADKDHKSTLANASVMNGDDQMTIQFRKQFALFGPKWVIEGAFVDYGPNMPDGMYYVEIESHSVGKATDIEEWIKGRWVIPFDDGDLYKKSGETEWSYSVMICAGIYMTKNGRVYSFNKNSLDWEETDMPYSVLVIYNNYEEVAKGYAMELIARYDLNIRR